MLDLSSLPTTPGALIERHIAGSPGAWYFQIQIVCGHNLQGGHFYYKRDARQALCQALARFLDDPEGFFEPKHPIRRRRAWEVHPDDDGE